MAKLEQHNVVIDRYVQGRCTTPGHYDTTIECSCGWSDRLNHGSGDVWLRLLGHRLSILERVASINYSVKEQRR